jgi:glycosyltransferase involved in cell wall biosynthesis
MNKPTETFMPSSLSFIIPVYNENGVIDLFLPELLKNLEELKEELDLELLLVDDGSTDGWEASNLPVWAKVIRHPINMGNGAAIKTGVRAAKNEYCLVMDGDGQHQWKDAKALLPLLEEYPLVVGARDFENSGTVHRNLANRVYCSLASFVSDFKIQDLTSGLRAFRRDIALSMLHLFPNQYSAPTTMTLTFLRWGYPIRYVGIDVLARKGTSKIRLFKDGFRFLLIILKISTLFSPMKIFLPVSASLALASLFSYIFFLLAESRFTVWTVILFTNAVTIFMIGLVAEEIGQLKTRPEDSRK